MPSVTRTFLLQWLYNRTKRMVEYYKTASNIAPPAALSNMTLTTSPTDGINSRQIATALGLTYQDPPFDFTKKMYLDAVAQYYYEQMGGLYRMTSILDMSTVSSNIVDIRFNAAKHGPIDTINGQMTALKESYAKIKGAAVPVEVRDQARYSYFDKYYDLLNQQNDNIEREFKGITGRFFYTNNNGILQVDGFTLDRHAVTSFYPDYNGGVATNIDAQAGSIFFSPKTRYTLNITPTLDVSTVDGVMNVLGDYQDIIYTEPFRSRLINLDWDDTPWDLSGQLIIKEITAAQKLNDYQVAIQWKEMVLDYNTNQPVQLNRSGWDTLCKQRNCSGRVFQSIDYSDVTRRAVFTYKKDTDNWFARDLVLDLSGTYFLTTQTGDQCIFSAADYRTALGLTSNTDAALHYRTNGMPVNKSPCPRVNKYATFSPFLYGALNSNVLSSVRYIPDALTDHFKRSVVPINQEQRPAGAPTVAVLSAGWDLTPQSNSPFPVSLPRPLPSQYTLTTMNARCKPLSCDNPKVLMDILDDFNLRRKDARILRVRRAATPNPSRCDLEIDIQYDVGSNAASNTPMTLETRRFDVAVNPLTCAYGIAKNYDPGSGSFIQSNTPYLATPFDYLKARTGVMMSNRLEAAQSNVLRAVNAAGNVVRPVLSNYPRQTSNAYSNIMQVADGPGAPPSISIVDTGAPFIQYLELTIEAVRGGGSNTAGLRYLFFTNSGSYLNLYQAALGVKSYPALSNAVTKLKPLNFNSETDYSSSNYVNFASLGVSLPLTITVALERAYQMDSFSFMTGPNSNQDPVAWTLKGYDSLPAIGTTPPLMLLHHRPPLQSSNLMVSPEPALPTGITRWTTLSEFQAAATALKNAWIPGAFQLRSLTAPPPDTEYPWYPQIDGTLPSPYNTLLLIKPAGTAIALPYITQDQASAFDGALLNFIQARSNYRRYWNAKRFALLTTSSNYLSNYIIADGTNTPEYVNAMSTLAALPSNLSNNLGTLSNLITDATTKSNAVLFTTSFNQTRFDTYIAAQRIADLWQYTIPTTTLQQALYPSHPWFRSPTYPFFNGYPVAPQPGGVFWYTRGSNVLKMFTTLDQCAPYRVSDFVPMSSNDFNTKFTTGPLATCDVFQSTAYLPSTGHQNALRPKDLYECPQIPYHPFVLNRVGQIIYNNYSPIVFPMFNPYSRFLFRTFLTGVTAYAIDYATNSIVLETTIQMMNGAYTLQSAAGPNVRIQIRSTNVCTPILVDAGCSIDTTFTSTAWVPWSSAYTGGSNLPFPVTWGGYPTNKIPIRVADSISAGKILVNDFSNVSQTATMVYESYSKKIAGFTPSSKFYSRAFLTGFSGYTLDAGANSIILVPKVTTVVAPNGGLKPCSFTDYNTLSNAVGYVSLNLLPNPDGTLEIDPIYNAPIMNGMKFCNLRTTGPNPTGSDVTYGVLLNGAVSSNTIDKTKLYGSGPANTYYTTQLYGDALYIDTVTAAGATNFPTAFKIEISQDGVTWYSVAEYTTAAPFVKPTGFGVGSRVTFNFADKYASWFAASSIRPFPTYIENIPDGSNFPFAWGGFPYQLSNYTRYDGYSLTTVARLDATRYTKLYDGTTVYPYATVTKTNSSGMYSESIPEQTAQITSGTANAIGFRYTSLSLTNMLDGITLLPTSSNYATPYKSSATLPIATSNTVSLYVKRGFHIFDALRISQLQPRNGSGPYVQIGKLGLFQGTMLDYSLATMPPGWERRTSWSRSTVAGVTSNVPTLYFYNPTTNATASTYRDLATQAGVTFESLFQSGGAPIAVAVPAVASASILTPAGTSNPTDATAIQNLFTYSNEFQWRAPTTDAAGLVIQFSAPVLASAITFTTGVLDNPYDIVRWKVEVREVGTSNWATVEDQTASSFPAPTEPNSLYPILYFDRNDTEPNTNAAFQPQPLNLNLCLNPNVRQQLADMYALRIPGVNTAAGATNDFNITSAYYGSFSNECVVRYDSANSLLSGIFSFPFEPAYSGKPLADRIAERSLMLHDIRPITATTQLIPNPLTDYTAASGSTPASVIIAGGATNYRYMRLCFFASAGGTPTIELNKVLFYTPAGTMIDFLAINGITMTSLGPAPRNNAQLNTLFSLSDLDGTWTETAPPTTIPEKMTRLIATVFVSFPASMTPTTISYVNLITGQDPTLAPTSWAAELSKDGQLWETLYTTEANRMIPPTTSYTSYPRYTIGPAAGGAYIPNTLTTVARTGADVVTLRQVESNVFNSGVLPPLFVPVKSQQVYDAATNTTRMRYLLNNGQYVDAIFTVNELQKLTLQRVERPATAPDSSSWSNIPAGTVFTVNECDSNLKCDNPGLIEAVRQRYRSTNFEASSSAPQQTYEFYPRGSGYDTLTNTCVYRLDPYLLPPALASLPLYDDLPMLGIQLRPTFGDCASNMVFGPIRNFLLRDTPTVTFSREIARYVRFTPLAFANGGNTGSVSKFLLYADSTYFPAGWGTNRGLELLNPRPYDTFRNFVLSRDLAANMQLAWVNPFDEALIDCRQGRTTTPLTLNQPYTLELSNVYAYNYLKFLKGFTWITGSDTTQAPTQWRVEYSTDSNVWKTIHDQPTPVTPPTKPFREYDLYHFNAQNAPLTYDSIRKPPFGPMRMPLLKPFYYIGSDSARITQVMSAIVSYCTTRTPPLAIPALGTVTYHSGLNRMKIVFPNGGPTLAFQVIWYEDSTTLTEVIEVDPNEYASEYITPTYGTTINLSKLYTISGANANPFYIDASYLPAKTLYESTYPGYELHPIGAAYDYENNTMYYKLDSVYPPPAMKSRILKLQYQIAAQGTLPLIVGGLQTASNVPATAGYSYGYVVSSTYNSTTNVTAAFAPVNTTTVSLGTVTGYFNANSSGIILNTAANYAYYRFTPIATRTAGSVLKIKNLSLYTRAGTNTYLEPTSYTKTYNSASSAGTINIIQLSNVGGSWTGTVADLTSNTANPYTDSRLAPLQLQLDVPPATLYGFGFTTNDDTPGADPVRWIFEGSPDGRSWILLHDQSAADAFVTPTRGCRTGIYPTVTTVNTNFLPQAMCAGRPLQLSDCATTCATIRPQLVTALQSNIGSNVKVVAYAANSNTPNSCTIEYVTPVATGALAQRQRQTFDIQPTVGYCPGNTYVGGTLLTSLLYTMTPATTVDYLTATTGGLNLLAAGQACDATSMLQQVASNNSVLRFYPRQYYYDSNLNRCVYQLRDGTAVDTTWITTTDSNSYLESASYYDSMSAVPTTPASNAAVTAGRVKGIADCYVPASNPCVNSSFLATLNAAWANYVGALPGGAPAFPLRIRSQGLDSNRNQCVYGLDTEIVAPILLGQSNPRLALDATISYDGTTCATSGKLSVTADPNLPLTSISGLPAYKYVRFRPLATRDPAATTVSVQKFSFCTVVTTATPPTYTEVSTADWTAQSMGNWFGTAADLFGDSGPMTPTGGASNAPWSDSMKRSIVFTTGGAGIMLHGFSFTTASASGSTGSDPVRWTVEGSSNGTTWQLLHDQSQSDATVTPIRNCRMPVFPLAPQSFAPIQRDYCSTGNIVTFQSCGKQITDTDVLNYMTTLINSGVAQTDYSDTANIIRRVGSNAVGSNMEVYLESYQMSAGTSSFWKVTFLPTPKDCSTVTPANPFWTTVESVGSVPIQLGPIAPVLAGNALSLTEYGTIGKSLNPIRFRPLKLAGGGTTTQVGKLFAANAGGTIFAITPGSIEASNIFPTTSILYGGDGLNPRDNLWIYTDTTTQDLGSKTAYGYEYAPVQFPFPSRFIRQAITPTFTFKAKYIDVTTSASFDIVLLILRNGIQVGFITITLPANKLNTYSTAVTKTLVAFNISPSDSITFRAYIPTYPAQPAGSQRLLNIIMDLTVTYTYKAPLLQVLPKRGTVSGNADGLLYPNDPSIDWSQSSGLGEILIANPGGDVSLAGTSSGFALMTGSDPTRIPVRWILEGYSRTKKAWILLHEQSTDAVMPTGSYQLAPINWFSGIPLQPIATQWKQIVPITLSSTAFPASDLPTTAVLTAVRSFIQTYLPTVPFTPTYYYPSATTFTPTSSTSLANNVVDTRFTYIVSSGTITFDIVKVVNSGVTSYTINRLQYFPGNVSTTSYTQIPAGTLKTVGTCLTTPPDLPMNTSILSAVRSQFQATNWELNPSDAIRSYSFRFTGYTYDATANTMIYEMDPADLPPRAAAAGATTIGFPFPMDLTCPATPVTTIPPLINPTTTANFTRKVPMTSNVYKFRYMRFIPMKTRSGVSNVSMASLSFVSRGMETFQGSQGAQKEGFQTSCPVGYTAVSLSTYDPNRFYLYIGSTNCQFNCTRDQIYNKTTGQCVTIPPGSQPLNEYTYIQCDYGKYCPGGNNPMTQCPPMTWNMMTNAASVSDCAYPLAGKKFVNSLTEPTPCPAGQYCPGGSLPASHCPPGTYNPNLGASNIAQCLQTSNGYYTQSQGSSSQIICPASQYCPAGTATPNNCPPGTYNLNQGASNISQCLSPLPGTYSTGATAPIPCPAGQYCLGGSNLASNCPPGTYNPNQGANNISQCLQTSNGYYTPSQGSSNQTICPAGQYCPAGTATPNNCSPGSYNPNQGASNISQCLQTSNGYYTPSQGSSNQIICLRGQYCPAGTGTPSNCPPGTYNSNLGASNIAQCLQTSNGYYTSNLGSSNQIICPMGQYCPAGTVTPSNCPPGTYNSNLGASSILQCVTTSVGYYASNAGSSNQTACPPGTYCTGGAVTPSNCLAGTYNPNPAASNCIRTSDGFYASNDKSTAQTACPPGQYCPAGTATPSNCPPGTYRTTTGASNVTQCLPVDPGSLYVNTTTAPQLCPAGQYCLGGSNLASNCPPGTYRNTTGASNLAQCLQCPAGSYCIEKTINPTTCAAGMYCPPGSKAAPTTADIAPAHDFLPTVRTISGIVATLPDGTQVAGYTSASPITLTNLNAITFDLQALQTIVGFTFTTNGTDQATDPIQWRVQGSMDGTFWMNLHQQTTDYATTTNRSCNEKYFYFPFEGMPSPASRDTCAPFTDYKPALAAQKVVARGPTRAPTAQPPPRPPAKRMIAEHPALATGFGVLHDSPTSRSDLDSLYVVPLKQAVPLPPTMRPAPPKAAPPAPGPELNTATSYFKYFRFRPLKTRSTTATAVAATGFTFYLDNKPIATRGMKVNCPMGRWKGGATEIVGADATGVWKDTEKSAILFAFRDQQVVTSFQFRTGGADTDPGMDPVRWKLEGSQNGTYWETLADYSAKDYPLSRERGWTTPHIRLD